MRTSKDITILIHFKLIVLAFGWFSGDFGALVEASYLVYCVPRSGDILIYDLGRRDYMFILMKVFVYCTYSFRELLKTLRHNQKL